MNILKYWHIYWCVLTAVLVYFNMCSTPIICIPYILQLLKCENVVKNSFKTLLFWLGLGVFIGFFFILYWLLTGYILVSAPVFL